MAEQKHAYLIVAHGNDYVLERLIKLLDDPRNDIYIHVDRKNKTFKFSHFQSLVSGSKLQFVAPRIDVRWGHISLTQVELALYRAAYNASTYQYYHLISGSDLPLKSQDDIYAFFRQHAGTEFIGFSDDRFDPNRIDKIHLFAKNMRAGEQEYLKRLGRKIRDIYIALQNKIGYSHTKNRSETFVYGSSWSSLTQNFVHDMLQQEEWILRFYRYANCSDEIYKQTFAYNSHYREKIYNLDSEFESNRRFIDWKRGRPYTFRKEDFEELMSSDMLFARKFEESVDTEIVDLIYDKLAYKE